MHSPEGSSSYQSSKTLHAFGLSTKSRTNLTCVILRSRHHNCIASTLTHNDISYTQGMFCKTTLCTDALPAAF
ncbi:hypothetical protein ES319_D05G214400v1 [Gossypium barbadense]|uniref:Uncharacterized protein n=1 Tax=Gossypium barbadense TaxID=3634 RepID=A0A5J5RFY5_GOSBA|nr:hypothetical protein ES319_D05G214400v1 [Gossypium barbadense]